MNDDQIGELLREMRDDPVPADSLARVRQAVAARTSGRGARRGFGMFWKLALPVAFAGFIAVVLLRPPGKHIAVPAPVHTVAAVEEPTPVLPPSSPVPKSHAAATVRTARHVRPKPASAPQAVGASLIRIETSDPGVVILLLADKESKL
ncbi:MAG TPA: hypothetical protein VH639_27920 [Bryobacteraceae bacterium]|jgi:hypothetical protein